jgi:anaerobic magnesium-protoporphyrin IX monomethyl ester cyclase
MDLLLAHAYFLAEDAEEQRIMRPYPPLGILYLSAHLKARGLDVAVFDGTFQSLSDFSDLLVARRPPLVGVYVNMMTKRHALKMIALARRAGATVIVGGPDPPYYAAEYLDAGAHVVVLGEGEATLEELVPALLGRAFRSHRLAGISGLVFRTEDGDLVQTPARAFLPDLSAQPHPDRASIDLVRYIASWRKHHGYGPVSLITARGCPYTCTWCSRSVFGTSHRRRSVADVVDEVQDIADRYHPDRLWYADDVFGIHRGWTLEYAEALRQRHLRLPFECISRAERIDDAVADAFADMGCWRVWIGSESGSQDVLDAMERRVTVERVREAAQRLRRRKIQVGLFIMLGFDGERREDLEATIEHLKQTSPDIFLTTVSYPIKGTPYYERVSDRIVARQPWTERTDRDLVIRERPGPRYYDFARRWITGEVARHQHWQERRYARAARAASSALIGRLGMTFTEHLQES